MAIKTRYCCFYSGSKQSLMNCIVFPNSTIRSQLLLNNSGTASLRVILLTSKMRSYSRARVWSRSMKKPRWVFIASAASSISSHSDRMAKYPRITPPKRKCSCGPNYPPRRYYLEQDSWQRFRRKRTAVWRSDTEGLSRRAKRESAETVNVSIGVLVLMACRRESSVIGLSLLRIYSCSDLSRRPDSCCKTFNRPVVSSYTFATTPNTVSAKAFSNEFGMVYIRLASSLKN